MDILLKYPEIKAELDKSLRTKRDEILSEMLKSDCDYKRLVDERTAASIALKNSLAGLAEANILFEKYSDTIYKQEIYELNAVYRHGITDAVTALINHQFL